MNNDLYSRIFVFSQQQMDLRNTVEKKQGKTPKFGVVIVNGTPKTYTDMVANMSQVRFADSVVVVSGDIRKIKYTQPS